MLDHAEVDFDEDNPPKSPCIELFDVFPNADFAAMSAEAAVSAPEYAEEYSLIAQAAAYEIKVLTPDDGWH